MPNDGQSNDYESLTKTHERLAQAHEELQRAYGQLERSNLELAEKARRLQALMDVAKSATSDLDLERVLDDTIRVACHLLGSDCCSIRMLDECGKELVTRASLGLSKKYLRKGNVKVGESIAGAALREGRVQTVEDVQQDSKYSYPELAAAEGLKSILCVPLAAKGKSIGVLTAYWKNAHAFSREETSVIEAVAELGGAAISAAAAHEELEGAHKQLSSLYSLSRNIWATLTLESMLDMVAEGVARELGAERVAVLLKESPSELVVRALLGPGGDLKLGSVVKLGEGISGWAARDGRVIVMNDPESMEASGVEAQGLKRIRSIISAPVKARGHVVGVITATNKLDPSGQGFGKKDAEYLEAIAGGAAAAIHAASLYLELQKNYVETLTGMAKGLEDRDGYTRGHSEKVAWLAAETATSMGMDQEMVESIRTAGLLHDVGKLGWTDAILRKKGPLTEEEWAEVREHPVIGARIVGAAEVISGIAPLVLAHHERLDGSGYPKRLKGEEIPFGARILGVADSYDAMTSARPYRETPLGEREARAELAANVNRLYDAEVVEAFLRAVQRAPLEEWKRRFKA